MNNIPIIETQPEYLYDEKVGLNFNVKSVVDAVVYRKAEYLSSGVLKHKGAHMTVYDALDKKINPNQVIKQSEGGWYVTVGWAVTKNASELDECLFFGRKMRGGDNGGEIDWLIALSQHNFVAWLSSPMCDKIIAKGVSLANQEDSEANRRTLGRVLEGAILNHAYLNDKGSVAGFSLGRELLELVDEYKLKSIATQKKTRLEGKDEYNIVRSWDPLGESKIVQQERAR